MTYIALTAYDVAIVIHQDTGFVGVKYDFLKGISTELGNRLEDFVVKVDGVKVVSLDRYCEIGKQVARVEHGLIDFNFDLTRDTVLEHYNTMLKLNDAEVVNETNAQYDNVREQDYIPQRRSCLEKVMEWRYKNEIDQVTGQNHSAIGQKLTKRICKEIDGRNMNDVRALVNQQKLQYTTHIAGSQRTAVIGEAWRLLEEYIEVNPPETVEEMYDLASRAGMNAAINQQYSSQMLPVRVTFNKNK